MDLRLSNEERPDATIVAVAGELDVESAPQLDEHLTAAIDGTPTLLVVDLSGVDSIGSSGLGALISGLKVARQAGGDLRIAAPGEQAVAVLELTNLNRVLKSYDHADSAFDDPT